MHPMLNIAIPAIRSAAKIVLRYSDQADSIQFKETETGDIITDVHLASEAEIIQHIKRAYPSHSILSKVSGHLPGDEYCWIIEPLDGTLNY